MDPITGLVCVSELMVEVGVYEQQLPGIMSGHVKLQGLGKKKPKYGCDHDYLIGGKDCNGHNAYICKCGQAFLGLGLALDHVSSGLEVERIPITEAMDNSIVQPNDSTFDQLGKFLGLSKDIVRVPTCNEYDDESPQLFKRAKITSKTMCPSSSFDTETIVLSEMKVMLGVCTGKFPAVMQGHVRPASGFINYGKNHRSLIKGKDTNNTSAYICECKEAFTNQSMAIHHFDKFNDTVVRISKILPTDQFESNHSTLDRLGRFLGLSKDSEQVSKCMDNYKVSERWSLRSNLGTKSLKENIKNGTSFSKIPYHEAIMEAIFFQFGYNLHQRFLGHLAQKLEVSKPVLVTMMHLAKNRTKLEDHIQAVLTAEILDEAAAIYKSLDKDFSSHYEDRVNIIPAVIRAIKGKYGKDLNTSFRAALAKKTDVYSEDVHWFFKESYNEDFESFTSETQLAADELYVEVVKVLNEADSSKRPLHKRIRNPEYVEKRLVLEGVFMKHGLDLSVEYRFACAAELNIQREKFQTWWTHARTYYKSTGELEFAEGVSESIMKKSQTLHDTVLQTLDNPNIHAVINNYSTLNENRLVLEAMLELNDGVPDRQYRNFICDKLFLSIGTVNTSCSYLRLRKKNGTPNCLTALFTKEIKAKAVSTHNDIKALIEKKLHNLVVKKKQIQAQKNNETSETDIRGEKNQKKRRMRPRVNQHLKECLMITYLQQSRSGNLLNSQIKLFGTKIGVGATFAQTMWSRSATRKKRGIPYRYQSLITQEIMDEANKLYDSIDITTT